ncbi:MAG: hypothetical protein FWD86_01560, partial [Firmicutes bacterium]|nr:hypothetical protein [Bacillota bacterium]
MKKISKIIIFLSIALLICSGFLLSGCVNRGNRIISYPTNLIRGVAIITQGGEHIFLDEVAYS